MGRVDTEHAPTVAAILDRYERECLSALAPRTAKDYRRHLGHLRARFGPLNAAELKPRDFGPFLDVRKGKIQRVRQLAVLSSAFTQAVSFWYVLERNVLRDVKRPKNPPRDRLVTKEEFARCKAMAPLRVGLAMELALLTGQRQSDVLGFRWSDIQGMDLFLQQSKTGKRLAIGITPQLEAVLDRCWKLNGTASPYVLPTRTGAPYTSEGFRASWQRTINRYCRLGHERFQFRDIRAMAATMCPTPEDARRLLGHTTIAMTMRVYRRGVEHVRALTPPT